MGHDWTRCPVLSVREDWRLTAVRQLDQHTRVGMSPGNADDFAAWVAPLLAEYRHELTERARQESK
jgi:hypothetical protein